MNVKNASASAKKFAALLKKIGPCSGPPMMMSAPQQAVEAGAAPAAVEQPQPTVRTADPLAALVVSMLLWDSTTDKAIAAYERLMEGSVDFNDLRVCMPQETIELIGPRYPRV